MKTLVLEITTHIEIEVLDTVDDDELNEVGHDVASNMDYSFIYKSEDAEIVDTEIIGVSVVGGPDLF
jgi:hypothetical protein